MAVEGFDGATFSGAVPVFPLPNVVFFPHTPLPLHIFEPRYRQMTRDALAGERMIAMALLKPGWESEYYGTPAVHEILGLGRIIEDTLLDDGRYNLVLYGLARVRVVELHGTEPYRTARVEVLQEQPAQGTSYDRRRRILSAFYAQLVKGLTQGHSKPPSDLPLGVLCDLLASLISFDVPVKQALLEELNIGVRCDRLLDLLKGLNAPGIGSPDEPAKVAWPPGPSMN